MALSFLLLLLLLSLLGCGGSPVHLVSRPYGSLLVQLLYSDLDTQGAVQYLEFYNDPVQPQVVVSRMSLNTSITPNNQPVVKKQIGQLVNSKVVVTGPNGCDNTNNPSQAVENSNCASNGNDLDTHYDLVHATWSIPPYTDECENAGGNELTCLGPVFLDNENRTMQTDVDPPSDIDLLLNYGAFLVSGYGPFQVPGMNTYVDMVMASLQISSTCTWPSNPALTFDGTYRVTTIDTWIGVPNLAAFVLQKQDTVTVLRVVLSRLPTSPSQYVVQLADAAGVGIGSTYFNVYYQSVAVLTPPLTESFPLLFGSPMTFFSTADFTTHCTSTLSLVNAPVPWQMNDCKLADPTNFADNDHQRFCVSRLCGYGVGGFNGINLEAAGNAFPALRQGGYLTLKPARIDAPGYIVTPDVGLAGYSLDCVDFYPPATTFVGYGINGTSGAVYPRSIPQADLCLAPFLFPAAITAANNPDEKAQQCNRLGGYAYGPGGDACYRRMGQGFCKNASLQIYYDQNCVYKPQLPRDVEFSGAVSGEVEACDQIGQSMGYAQGKMVPLVGADTYDRIWVETRYMYALRNPFGQQPVVRLTVGEFPVCYQLQVVDPTRPDLDTVKTFACPVNAKVFPVCVVPWIGPAAGYEPAGAFQIVAPETIAILRDGRGNGTVWDGEPDTCQCVWGGRGRPFCTVPTCPIQLNPSIPVYTPVTGNGLDGFQSRCYSFGKGECIDGDPLTCSCVGNFGPSSTFGDALDKTPCYCPASDERGGLSLINGNTTAIPSFSKTPCNGAANGECEANSATGLGKCRCFPRFNPLTRLFEADLVGEACTCRQPLVVPGFTYDVPQTQALPCNGRGKCTTSGCVCDSGWTGDACSCTAPPNLLATTLLNNVLVRGTVFAKLATAAQISVVRVSAQAENQALGIPALACPVTAVYLSTAQPPTPSASPCTYSNVEGDAKWVCDPSLFFSYVVVVTSLGQTAFCRIQAFALDAGACGLAGHTNPFAARFYASSNYISPPSFKLQPQPRLASQGCTPTSCACAPNWAGGFCSVGVSSLRQDASGQLAHSVCGELTFPPNGKYVLNQFTNVASCQCNALTSTDPTQNFGGAASVAVGNGCQSAMITNLDRQRQMMCAGFGTNVEPEFPFGTCSLDLEQQDSDWLFTPLASHISGPYNCADPVNRFVQQYRSDSSSFCRGAQQTVLPYSYAYGEAYGLFEDRNPRLVFSFLPPTWTSAHYNFLASMQNGVRCFDFLTGQPLWVLDEPMIDAYLSYLANQANYTDLPSLLHNLTQSIEVQLKWPYNPIVAQAVAQNVGIWACRSMDVSSPLDQAFLQTFWESFLAQRRCTSDNFCSRFLGAGGTCEYVGLAAGFAAWRNGDPLLPPGGGVGDEGGCQCFSSYALGFQEPQTRCSTCLPGYGPLDAQEFADMVQYQLTLQAQNPGLNPLFDPTQQPWATLLTLQGDALFDAMNSTLYCRMPFNGASIGKMCSGHGFANQVAWTRSVSVDSWTTPPGYLSVVACPQLDVGGLTYELEAVPESPFALAYKPREGKFRNVSAITVLGRTTLWWTISGVTQPALLLECASPNLPFLCTYAQPQTLAGQPGVRADVACKNSLLLYPGSHLDVTNFELSQVRSTQFVRVYEAG